MTVTQTTQKWQKLIEAPTFERQIAMHAVDEDRVFALLSDSAFLRLFDLPRPTTTDELLDLMVTHHILVKEKHGLYGITNLGALCFANNIFMFASIASKAFRLIKYDGTDRTKIKKGLLWEHGYAVDFDKLVMVIKSMLPGYEVFGDVYLRVVTPYPDELILEWVLNAFMHQDLTIENDGPWLEIFDHRIEISNPCERQLSIERLMVEAPVIMNRDLYKALSQLTTKDGDKHGLLRVGEFIERMNLPAPSFEATGSRVRVTTPKARPFLNLTVGERLGVCYWHALMQAIHGDTMSKASLLDRVGFGEVDMTTVSNVIFEALRQKLIKPVLDQYGQDTHQYVPYGDKDTEKDI